MVKKKVKLDPPQEQLLNVVFDKSKPVEMRAHVLLDSCLTGVVDHQKTIHFLARLLEQAEQDNDSIEAKQKKKEFEEKVKELEMGTARPATFIEMAVGTLPGSERRVQVITPDGQERYPLLNDTIKPEALFCGMTVFMDEKGVMVTGFSRMKPKVGEEAVFLRSIPETRVIEVSYRDEKMVLYAHQCLHDALEQGKLERGDPVLFCPRRHFAFERIEPENNRELRYIDRSQMPTVIATRDIGDPHPILGYLVRRTHVMLFREDLLNRYELRPRCCVLMTGRSGTGKTLTIRAFLHEFRCMLAERTGRTDIGTRVIRLKMSELLSKWFGESDKNIDALMDDIHALGSEEVETADGRRIRLPLVVILEEAEGIARRRGEYDGSVYDRVIGTLLQRLDDPTHDLAGLPIITIATTNRPDMFDAAMWRRLAGVRAHFERLTRAGTAAVLDKKLKDHFPYATDNGATPEEVRDRIIDQIVSTLFSPNGDDGGLVEITLRDGKKELRYARDFLTGATVEQAVSNAIDRAVFASTDEGTLVGLSARSLLDSLHDVVGGLADNLTAHNVYDYLDLPEYPSVAGLRRLEASNGNLTHVAL
jgi:ATP-dependent 26S proteasome regulatory subunit